MRFSGVLGFISDLLPFIQSAERIFGAGGGQDKRNYVEGRLRTVTQAAQQRLGVLDELDPTVKSNRAALIDLAVDEAILYGDLPGTEDQRLKAGLALGFVSDTAVADAYGKLQRGARLTAREHDAWEAYRKALPPLPLLPPAPTPDKLRDDVRAAELRKLHDRPAGKKGGRK